MTGGSASLAVLLDTCALIWLATRAPIAQEAKERIVKAAMAGAIFVSPICAWEIGLLSRPRTGRAHQFLPDPATWFARFMAGPGMRPAPFTAQITIAASLLPQPLHGDHGDRLLIATARDMNLPILTRDQRIIDYGASGHVALVAC